MVGRSDSSHDDPCYTGSSVQHAHALHALLRAKDGAVAVAARLPACTAGRRTSLLSPLPAADRGTALHPSFWRASHDTTCVSLCV